MSSYDYARAIQDVIEESAGPRAADVDRGGAFPRANIDALADAGLLGLVSAEDAGGRGAGLGAAAHVVERLAGACGSTAMVLLMHYAATALIEAHGPKDVREAIAGDAHLSTLAFSEAGSRSHFWAPLGTAAPAADGRVLLDADKSWVTSAGEADSYVWSSRPLAADGPMTLWLVPRDRERLSVRGPFDGLGLRGNASSPVSADGVLVDREAMLGPDGEGLDLALGTALPHFLVLSAAFSLGLMEALTAKAAEHLTRTRLEHLGQTLADQPTQRARFAELRIRTDQVRAFLRDALAALAEGRADATLRVLEVKAVAAESASEVADATMRLCGGAAFRKEFGVERLFRDSLAARVMAPTTQALHDFVGRASLGMPLF
ncbi:acyl-CoA dehydrogenase family protein [Actinomadura montaniterrae]|uniref:Acyl-CoA dehydrogenase n=1 Tax=Actinomadura montaniterrae TaxID=1803903 RepID=A0A6L3VIK3_9ACTN|nr:acyl-CoA dehydrogenase family protein [Actinomadura montaniterrae]KAB2370617.1 acyl-CoA dehydrogenase [Actinomadura montaniterrae]